jgi:hypothetical protein
MGVLQKVAEGDPSEFVRHAAAETLREFRHMRKGWTPGSHKRLVFHAWWWIRQAHRLALGLETDEVEANRTRNTEFR